MLGHGPCFLIHANFNHITPTNRPVIGVGVSHAVPNKSALLPPLPQRPRGLMPHLVL